MIEYRQFLPKGDLILALQYTIAISQE